MKKRIDLRHLILFTIIFMLTACKKDKAVPTDINTLLTYKKWKPAVTDLHPETNPKGKVIYYAWSECDLDNTYSYSKEQVYRIDYGKKKCTEWSKDEDVSDYVMILRDSVRTIHYSMGEIVEIYEISADQLKLSTVLSDSGTGADYMVKIFHH